MKKLTDTNEISPRRLLGLLACLCVCLGSINHLAANSAAGLGLDDAFLNTDFGAARSLSGDGSVVYFESYDPETFDSLYLRYDAASGQLVDFSGDYTFNLSDIGFATSFDGSLAVLAPLNPETGFSEGSAIVGLNAGSEIVEQYELSEEFGFLNNVLFVGRTDSLILPGYDAVAEADVLLRLGPQLVSGQEIYVETESYALGQNSGSMILGNNNADQAVVFFQVSSVATNFNVSDAGFYLVGEAPGSIQQITLDFSPVLEVGAELENLFVQPEGMSPGGRYVIMESDDSVQGQRSLLYDFEDDLVYDVGARLPGDFSNALRSVFPTDALRIPSFNPGQMVERVDADGNLIGRAINSNFETVGTFVVTNTPAPQVIALEDYLAANFAAPADMSMGAFMAAVELRELVAFSEDNSTVLLAGIDVDGFSDAFLLRRDTPIWYADAAETEPVGWRYFDWFKGFKPEGPNWIFHGRHGWLYVLADDTSGMFLWDVALGRWMFTNATTYPWMYAYGPNEGWVFFFEGGRPGSRFFKRGDNGQVLSEAELNANAVSTIQVLGQVNQPGELEFPTGRIFTLIEAIAGARGVTRLGNPREILIRRESASGEARTLIVDLNAIIAGESDDVELRAGDIVFVPERVI